MAFVPNFIIVNLPFFCGILVVLVLLHPKTYVYEVGPKRTILFALNLCVYFLRPKFGWYRRSQSKQECSARIDLAQQQPGHFDTETYCDAANRYLVHQRIGHQREGSARVRQHRQQILLLEWHSMEGI